MMRWDGKVSGDGGGNGNYIPFFIFSSFPFLPVHQLPMSLPFFFFFFFFLFPSSPITSEHNTHLPTYLIILESSPKAASAVLHRSDCHIR